MKKLICIMLSAIMTASAFAVVPMSASAAKKKAPAVSLKKKSATLRITASKKGKAVYGTTKIKLKKAKGVKITKTAFSTSNKKIAKVSKNGKVTAVKKGSAKIAVKVKYTLKKRSYKKTLSFKVTVRDMRKKTPAPTEPVTETETVTETEPVTETAAPTSLDTEPTESETIIPIPTEIGTEPETETQTDTETEPPTSLDTWPTESEPTETVTEKQTETVTETEKVTETETETVKETETVTETETETETEIVTETVTETETQSTVPQDVEAISKKLNDVPEIPFGGGYISDKEFLKKLSEFSNKLYAMCAESKKDNYVMSPVSVYMAMAMLYRIGDSGVKADITELINMNDAQMAQAGNLFLALTDTFYSYNHYEGTEEVIGRIFLTDSIWLNSGEKADAETLKALADELFCQAFETPFSENNAAANKAVSDFISEKTYGLINKNFNLQPSTVFALINTIYFKDSWDAEIEKLYAADGKFTTENGEINTEFLYGKYVAGQVQQTKVSDFFYTTTRNGYKIKFILPKEGFTLSDAMSAENLNAVNSATEFNELEGENIRHFTRCIFPSFKITSDTELLDIMKSNGLLKNSLTGFFSPLMENRLLEVSDIKHTTTVDVNDKGVEAAAVTIITINEGAAPIEDKNVYHTFTLDRSFGFIITNPNDIVLFEGQVTRP